MWLCTINDPSHLGFFLFIQVDVSRSPVLLQSVWLGGSRDSDEALSGHPSKSNLCDTAPFQFGQLLDLLDNGPVFVKVVALELGRWKNKVNQYKTQTPSTVDLK